MGEGERLEGAKAGRGVSEKDRVLEKAVEKIM